jgi:hypothetical protein
MKHSHPKVTRRPALKVLVPCPACRRSKRPGWIESLEERKDWRTSQTFYVTVERYCRRCKGRGQVGEEKT